MNTLAQLRNGELAGSRHLKLCCGLTHFPPQIFELADTLEILDLSGNQLSALPDDLPRLRHLRILFCSENQFSELPAILGQCPALEMIGFKANRIQTVPAAALPEKLRWLILTDNQVRQLPAEIGRCGQLQKLMLAGNRLTALPSALAACCRLELLRISSNRLTELPAWLLALPRLSWLAYAGNPFSVEFVPAPLPAIAWSQLLLLRRLGEGASGVIYQASWQQALAEQEVAVKLFKGTLTSDGLPLHEMHACIRAGSHPHLIPLLGRVVEHPASTDGLVMALIEPHYRSLADPPSLASCTRDIYPDATVFSAASVIRLARGMAAAVSHLHSRGIMHGDLYAHNILYQMNGAALLGDFGAASSLDLNHPAQAEALQRLEVRAFGCLLEELLVRSAPAPDAAALMAALADLQAACVQEFMPGRPLFAEILESLEAMLADCPDSIIHAERSESVR